jgi:hypothetical protein
MLSHEDPRALDQLGRDRFEWHAGSSSVSSSDGRRLRLTEATGAESEAAIPERAGKGGTRSASNNNNRILFEVLSNRIESNVG